MAMAFRRPAQRPLCLLWAALALVKGSRAGKISADTVLLQQKALSGLRRLEGPLAVGIVLLASLAIFDLDLRPRGRGWELGALA